MINAELAFSNRHVKLSPRSFSVNDGLSRLFEVCVVATSPDADLDLDKVAGHACAFRLALPGMEQPYAVWSGICNEIEQVGVEEEGLSLYALHIVPMLWRTTQRHNFRIFQHATAVEAVCSLLEEWDIEPELRIDKKALPQDEYRVQFGESDLSHSSAACSSEDGHQLHLRAGRAQGGGESDEPDEQAARHAVHAHESSRCRHRSETGKVIDSPMPYAGHTRGPVGHGKPFVSKVCIGRKAFGRGDSRMGGL